MNGNLLQQLINNVTIYVLWIFHWVFFIFITDPDCTKKGHMQCQDICFKGSRSKCCDGDKISNCKKYCEPRSDNNCSKYLLVGSFHPILQSPLSGLILPFDVACLTWVLFYRKSIYLLCPTICPMSKLASLDHQKYFLKAKHPWSMCFSRHTFTKK